MENIFLEEENKELQKTVDIAKECGVNPDKYTGAIDVERQEIKKTEGIHSVQ